MRPWPCSASTRIFAPVRARLVAGLCITLTYSAESGTARANGIADFVAIRAKPRRRVIVTERRFRQHDWCAHTRDRGSALDLFGKVDPHLAMLNLRVSERIGDIVDWTDRYPRFFERCKKLGTRVLARFSVQQFDQIRTILHTI